MAARDFVGRHAGSVLTGAMAVPLAAWGMAYNRIAFTVIGAGMAIFAAGLPRLKDFDLSPGRVKVALHDQRDQEFTLDVSSEPARELNAAADDLEPDEFVPAARAVLAWGVLPQVLAPGTGPLADARLRLYLFDADSDELVPVDVDGDDVDRGAWDVGQGAVGTAFASGEFVFVEGPAVSDDTYGLSVEQQQRYADLVAVAAIPVTNAAGDTIAVLSAASTHRGHALDEQEAFNELVLRADLVARTLIDLLHWFPDSTNDG